MCNILSLRLIYIFVCTFVCMCMWYMNPSQWGWCERWRVCTLRVECFCYISLMPTQWRQREERVKKQQQITQKKPLKRSYTDHCHSIYSNILSMTLNCLDASDRLIVLILYYCYFVVQHVVVVANWRLKCCTTREMGCNDSKQINCVCLWACKVV